VNNFHFSQRVPNHSLAFNIDFDNSRISSNNPFLGLNPYLSSRLTIGITQPLLRGFRTDPQRTEIAVRSKAANLSEVDLEIRTIDIVTRVEQTYWDLVGARDGADVARESAQLAREQVEVNQRQIAAGTLAPVELSASEAEFQRRIDTWYQTLALVTEVENRLKTFIAPDRNSNIWGDEIVPTDLDTRSLANPNDVRTAINEALQRRPELRAVGVQTDINGLQTRLNRENLKPQVNLVAQYIMNGLGGSTNLNGNPFGALNQGLYARLNQLSAAAGLQPLPVQEGFGAVPVGLVGGYGTALNNLFLGRYTGYQAGLQIDWNVRNRTAQSNLAQSLIAEKRLKYDKARVEQLIAAEVRNALQNIDTARQRIVAAEAGVKAAQDKLQSETRLFQTGESTNFLVLTRQNEATESRRRLVLSRLDFNKSVSRLEQALGATLRTYHVTVR
jgi:HAE1 family hydrophobic/amphiphilic exporter-1